MGPAGPPYRGYQRVMNEEATSSGELNTLAAGKVNPIQAIANHKITMAFRCLVRPWVVPAAFILSRWHHNLGFCPKPIYVAPCMTHILYISGHIRKFQLEPNRNP
ncbi:unnamed protein product [Discosporangium mesarthrocarpum]